MRVPLPRMLSIVICAAVFASRPLHAGADPITIVVPGGSAGVEGAVNFGFPFNVGPFPPASQRYQQLFRSDQFTQAPGRLRLSGVAFRPDASTGNAFVTTIQSAQINLSTTRAGLSGGLSLRFDENIGGDETLVHAGPLTLSSGFTGPAEGPKDFDIFVPFSQPFLYDPSAGNLLMDVRNFADSSTSQFDAYVSLLEPSGIRDVSVYSADVASPVGLVADATGLIARFTFEPAAPIPEPSSLFLLGAGIAACARSVRGGLRIP